MWQAARWRQAGDDGDYGDDDFRLCSVREQGTYHTSWNSRGEVPGGSQAEDARPEKRQLFSPASRMSPSLVPLKVKYIVRYNLKKYGKLITLTYEICGIIMRCDCQSNIIKKVYDFVDFSEVRCLASAEEKQLVEHVEYLWRWLVNGDNYSLSFGYCVSFEWWHEAICWMGVETRRWFLKSEFVLQTYLRLLCHHIFFKRK